MFEDFERGKVEIDGLAISYVMGGSGPPVLLLHGFPQTLALWAAVSPRLAQTFTVVCADLRGYGDSGKPPCASDCANYSFRAMALDNILLMKALGFENLHVVGHDRNGRAGHRMALDHPHAVKSLSLLDIVPTHTMLAHTNRHVAGAYWHWFFPSQQAPFPERLIAHDPDTFYETCLVGWGAATLDDFAPAQIEDYRRCWRMAGMIHGSCCDYRAAATIDFAHDEADLGRRVDCPALVLYGSQGVMARYFDIAETWRPRLANMTAATIPGGHFIIDAFPEDTARVLAGCLARQA